MLDLRAYRHGLFSSTHGVQQAFPTVPNEEGGHDKHLKNVNQQEIYVTSERSGNRHLTQRERKNWFEAIASRALSHLNVLLR